MASLTAESAVNGGATMISTPVSSATNAFYAVVSATASEMVLFSFQFPAIIGIRIFLKNLGGEFDETVGVAPLVIIP